MIEAILAILLIFTVVVFVGVWKKYVKEKKETREIKRREQEKIDMEFVGIVSGQTIEPDEQMNDPKLFRVKEKKQKKVDGDIAGLDLYEYRTGKRLRNNKEDGDSGDKGSKD